MSQAKRVLSPHSRLQEPRPPVLEVGGSQQHGVHRVGVGLEPKDQNPWVHRFFFLADEPSRWTNHGQWECWALLEREYGTRVILCFPERIPENSSFRFSFCT